MATPDKPLTDAEVDRAVLDGNLLLPYRQAVRLYADRGDPAAFEAMAAAWHNQPDTDKE